MAEAVKMGNYTDILADLVFDRKPKKGLEVGLREGHSARTFLGNTDGTLVSVDKNDHFNIAPLNDKHSLLIGDSSTILREMQGKEKFDYIYIDGDHGYDGCKADIEAAIPLLSDDGVLVMDDYGVEGFSGGVTFDDNGNAVDGEYGVKQAADELLAGWTVLDYKLGNGGQAYVRPAKKVTTDAKRKPKA